MIKIKRKQTKKLKKQLQLESNNHQARQICDLGAILQEKGQLDDAITYYQKALQLNPNHAVAFYNLASAYHKKGQSEKAIIYYQKVLQLDQNAFAYNNLGTILQEKGELNEAITCYKNALKLNPDYDNAYTNLGSALLETGQLNEAEFYYRRVIQRRPNNLVPFENLLNTMLYKSRCDAQTAFSEHLKFATRYAEPLSDAIVHHSNERTINRRLKIGYVSPDFRKHAVAYFIEPVIIAHNREHFEIFCYSNGLLDDEVTKRIQNHTNQWRSILEISDEEAAELIRKDEIDILIDLAGYTANNRILLFARKPAPVQISWIGYLATTGLSTIDYKIADNYTDPPGDTERFYIENLIRLPESFLCYLPDRDSPAIGSLPALSTGYITFGSFNKLIKMTPEVFALWAKILEELPDSRLILKGKSFHDKATRQYATNMFTQRGIAAERITLQSWDPSPKHLDAYNQVDIGLDTFPFNGAATTCEAMWMGVPVITLAGTAYHSRVGVSLLSNVSLPELVAKTSDEYVSIAINLAKDLKRLQSLREHLRDMMTYSPLCDAKRFTVNLELCYRKIWETYCKSV
jgi:protein O-GlcNAc transferase